MQNSIWIYRLYDVAEEIKLDRVEEILCHQHQTSRLRLSRTGPKSIQIENPPVAVDLGESPVIIDEQAFSAQFTGKIYDLGVIVITMRLALPQELQFDQLTGLSIAVYNSELIEQVLNRQLDYTRKILAPALVKEELSGFVEDFTIFYFRDWQDTWDPVPLLLAETEPVSQAVRQETLRNSFSYGLDDLAIITWDSALVHDPSGSADIPDLLEFANAQLLELRYYDNLLTGEMKKMYGAIEEAEKLGSFRRLNHYRRIMGRLMELIVDVTEITERIDNSLKVTEDVFYARVYSTTLSIFRTKTWEESINRKINIINQSYSMLSNRNVNQRSELLELTIVLLILIEVFLGVFGFLS
ncbi:MAG: hypothetical protein A4E53_01764 [Pelotomaculum sp. PtaB.Bin104]|nr:MAG: hypothetical protein A4E53_01764 [Pelotomaculum sp. PtaB.Bin104]